MVDPSLPYASRRPPVCAANVVATSQPLAAYAGLEAITKGGNAIDAALAAAITLTVVEPSGNGVGSDAFALLWDGAKLHGINGSGRAPRLWTPERFAKYTEMPTFGWDTVTVPGAVSVWVAMSERFGRLSFESLFERAIEYAETGFQVGPRVAHLWRNHPDELTDYRGFVEHFHPAPEFGERVSRPHLGATLRDIAETRGESFYRGRLAESIERAAIDGGGGLRFSDLATHSADWVESIAVTFRDVHAHEIPPNGQGIAALIALAILDRLEVPDLDCADAAHVQIEAMKIGIRAAAEHVADPSAMTVHPEVLLDPDNISRLARMISRHALSIPPAVLPSSRDTVYLAAADAEGRMVSFIQSNFYGFGSGVVIPDTGIAMQNRGWGFSLEAGHPNHVRPGKRPFHTIIPGFVTRGGKPLISFGVMGGPMQPQGHVQMITRLIDYGQNPQAASDAPRWLVDEAYAVTLEPGFDRRVAAELAERGHEVRYADDDLAFGGAQIVLRTDDGYVAGSDHRKDGLAIGF